jgi:hypothetical protein
MPPGRAPRLAVDGPYGIEALGQGVDHPIDLAHHVLSRDAMKTSDAQTYLHVIRDSATDRTAGCAAAEPSGARPTTFISVMLFVGIANRLTT